MNKEFKLTKQGLDELKKELDERIKSRADVAMKLKVARDHGDLRENAEYHNAREEQSNLEARIAEIEKIIKNAEVVKAPTDNNKVSLGSTVVLNGEKGEQTYTVVSSVESNPAEAKISDQSPIGQALLGASVGDKVTISLPAGDMKYTVKAIK